MNCNLEFITRKFCEIRGIDPDANMLIPCPDGIPGCCVAHYGPTWKAYESAVRDGIALIEAIGVAPSAEGSSNGTR